MRRQENRERGSSAVESGLTLAGVAVFLTPLLFYMGLQLRQAMNAPCDTSAVACADAAKRFGRGGGTGGGGPAAAARAAAARAAAAPVRASPTVALQGRVITHPGRRLGRVRQPDVPHPAAQDTRATCTVTFADGHTRDYRVRWTDNAGSIRLTPH